MLLSLLCGVLHTGSLTDTKTVLKVGYLPATHDLLLFIAHDAHFAEEEGIDLQLSQFHNSPEILQALVAETIDVGIPGIAAPVMYISNGAPLHIIGGAAKNSAAVVVVPKFAQRFDGKSPDAKLQLFKGMRIGTVKQSTGDAIFRHSLKEAGLLLDVDIREFVSPAEVLTALQSGGLDGAVLWSPHMSTAETKQMPIVLWIYELMKEHEHVCCRQVVQNTYLRRHRPALVAYTKALIRAMRFYQDPAHKQDVLAIVSRYIPGTSQDILQKELYGESPRTTISVDISQDEIARYVEAMEKSGDLSAAQGRAAIASIDSTIILDAYKSLGLPISEADDCVRNGFLAFPFHLKKQPSTR
jgi:NitT/TauT family transport system substrate-binding protein